MKLLMPIISKLLSWLVVGVVATLLMASSVAVVLAAFVMMVSGVAVISIYEARDIWQRLRHKFKPGSLHERSR